MRLAFSVVNRPRRSSRWWLLVLAAGLACGTLDWAGSYRYTAAGGSPVTDLTLSGTEPNLTIDHYGISIASPASVVSPASTERTSQGSNSKSRPGSTPIR